MHVGKVRVCNVGFVVEI